MMKTAAKPSIDGVWRALADPGRRQMLDLLRERPLTTGELAGHFPYSRYAVMKHLKCLVEAGLVVVHRRGRERWNHLNPVPIRQIQRRWLRPFEAGAADALLAIKRIAEKGDEPMTSVESSSFRCTEIVLEVSIAAPRSRVWSALIDDLTPWWPRDFYAGQTPRAFRIEPQLGGRMYEDWGDGDGLVWATVTGIQRERMLLLSGDLSAEFGGPARTSQKITLEDDGPGSRLRLVDTGFGALDDSTAASLADGWKTLFEGALKSHVESE